MTGWEVGRLLVYPLTLLAALFVAIGEVIQQRAASYAPPEHNLSPRLLVWLARRPQWLAGVAGSIAGNVLFAIALRNSSLALVEALFVVRLLFALVLAAAWGQHRVPARDLLGSVAISVGLIGFIYAARPNKGVGLAPDMHWVLGGGCVVIVAALLTALARRADPTRKAVLLGTASGVLFALQASLTQRAVHVLSERGIFELLLTWEGYACALTALIGMLLMQSAFEAAPLPASYPAVVTTELVAGVAMGVLVLGGTLALGTVAIAATGASLLVMIAGICVLTTSPLVTGQLDRLARLQDVGLAWHVEQQLARELHRADRAAQRWTRSRGGTVWLRRELRRIDDDIGRLGRLQEDIRRHRDAEEKRLQALPAAERREFAVSAQALRERERAIDEHAQRLRARAIALAAARGLTWRPATEG